MLKYLINPKNSITTDWIGRTIQDFSTRHLPNLNKYWNYYVGKQKIFKKRPSDIGKPNNIVQVNYCNSIVKNYNGYLTGIPITYSNDDFKEVLDVINYNDPAQEDNEYLKQALIYGRAFECNYIDEDGKQRFKLFDTRECIPVYANTLNGELLYVIRFYKETLTNEELGEDHYIVEVYGPREVQIFRSAPGFTSFTLVEEYPHFFNQCPVTVFSLNEEEESIFYQVITLQDTYNTLLSSGADDYQAWADAYLVLKGVIADTDDLNDMKANRVLIIDNDADASYLTKDVNNEQLEYLLKTIDEQIHNISNSPNLNSEKFYSQSGIAIRYKLVGFETVAANIETYMKRALQRRIELISSILHLTADDEAEWRDVEIKFTRNLPVDMSEDIENIVKLRGLVRDTMLLQQLPFIKDAEEAYKLLKQQEQEEMQAYEFNHTEDSWGN